ncbi:MAG: hypothetical protein ACYSTI_12235 [Planctomycetota bacterium]|jgi:hypothetical protein
MFYSRFKYFTVIISVLLSISLVGLSGCTETDIIIPEFREPSPPPPIVDVNQLSSEYASDADAADVKYKGERLLFNQLEVEEVIFQSFSGFAGDDNNFKVYFKNGGVSFVPQGILMSIMQSIETGFILNVEGICLGLIGPEDSIAIEISWVESIKGDIGPREVVDTY